MADSSKKIKLLFITQRINDQDDDLAFVIQWIDEFIKNGVEVQVICLWKGSFDNHFPVYSLGKENNLPKWRWILNFYKLIFSLKYTHVFVHMNPEWSALGGWYWRMTGRKFYLWYTHYTMTWYLRLTGWLANNMFCATPQSLPQYSAPKKVVTGHGIDLSFWADAKGEKIYSAKNILTIHRICRSKRLEIVIKALLDLPVDYTLTIYGRDVESDYADEMRALVKELKLDKRVKFMGPLPAPELKKIYPQYSLMVNMASETIDKTMLEAMLFGIFPVTTRANSEAIGLPVYPENDEPATIAKFILDASWSQIGAVELRQIVEERHSLSSLIKKIIKYF